jgi:hypothetical protein
MALATRLSNRTAIAMCDAWADQFDLDAAAGYSEIYDGAQPADPDTAITTQVLLGTVTYGATAFGAAVDDTPGAIATSIGTPTGTGVANGTPTWFRSYDGGGGVVSDGTAGTAGTDMILDSATIAVGQVLNVISHTLKTRET